MHVSVSSSLALVIRLGNGVASRLRNFYYRALGVEITGYAWLRKIEIKQNFSDISLAAGVALDTGVILFVSGITNGKKKIIIGDNTYVNRYSFIDASAEIRIGRDVGIGPSCYITDHDHGTVPGEPVMTQPLVSKAVTICDGVWLGAGVIVLKGVTIGKNTIVAAGSIVVRDLPSDVIAKGRPAMAVRRR